MIILIAIFSLCTLGILHTYVIYPFSLELKKASPRRMEIPFVLPEVDILIAAYNEDKVILDKINSILVSDYPKNRLRILVGSDGSSDHTEDIVQGLVDSNECISLIKYPRSGKTSTVNKLMDEAKAEFVILTDANVMFTEDTIKTIISYFCDPKVGLVGANIKAIKNSDVGITHQENEYLQRENRMKLKEGEIWGTMMGAFGGCYAMRRKLFKKVPEHFLVDDFHITMSVLDQGHDAVLGQEAICYEDISSKLSEEFRRKVRMSTGNFQNLKVFSKFLFHQRKGLSYSFISHKVLRWVTPILLVTSFIISLLLMSHSKVFLVLFYIQLTVFSIPLMEMTLEAIGIRSRLIRFITYFISMNVALLIGMINSIRGVKKATWQPTERNL